jgi:hypothetical protein
VQLDSKEQGKADHQDLNIRVQGLDANYTYQLSALLDENTNLLSALSFSTDANGAATLMLRDFSQGNPKANIHSHGHGNGHGHGHGKGNGRQDIPDVLNPISSIRELDVVNSNAQSVLVADLTAPSRLTYLVKRDLSSQNVNGQLRIQATNKKAQFGLSAAGLNPTNDYLLSFNGGIVQTNSTDSTGRLRISAPMETATDILDLHSVALLDNSSNVVLSTTLP